MSLPLRNLPPPLVVVLVLVDILAKSDILATINRSFDFDNGGFVGWKEGYFEEGGSLFSKEAFLSLIF